MDIEKTAFLIGSTRRSWCLWGLFFSFSCVVVPRTTTNAGCIARSHREERRENPLFIAHTILNLWAPLFYSWTSYYGYIFKNRRSRGSVLKDRSLLFCNIWVGGGHDMSAPPSSCNQLIFLPSIHPLFKKEREPKKKGNYISNYTALPTN